MAEKTKNAYGAWSEFVDIDADVAREMLKFNRPYEPGVKGTNRKVSPAKVKQYAEAMVNGHWRTTHQGIGFSTETWLIDGQHRLLAICEADRMKPGIVIRMQVTRNLKPDTFMVIDTNKRRKLADVLAHNGHANTIALGSTARLVYAYFNVPYTSARGWLTAGDDFSSDLLNQTIEEHPMVVYAVEFGLPFRRVGNETSLRAAFAIAKEIREDMGIQVEDFFTKVALQEDVHAGHPAYELGYRLSNFTSSRTNVAKVEQLALAIKAFNHFAEGRKTIRGSLRLSDKEAFPRVMKADD